MTLIGQAHSSRRRTRSPQPHRAPPRRPGKIPGYVLWAALLLLSVPVPLHAQTEDTVRTTGVSALWILANFSFAGMRAQGSPQAGQRILAFIFGFPGTLLTLIFVREGGRRAYGVDLPSQVSRPDRDR
jgi:hypothetical protein